MKRKKIDAVMKKIVFYVCRPLSFVLFMEIGGLKLAFAVFLLVWAIEIENFWKKGENYGT